jgi:hypothetical protein
LKEQLQEKLNFIKMGKKLDLIEYINQIRKALNNLTNQGFLEKIRISSGIGNCPYGM